MTKPYQLFISYSSEDEPYANELARAFKFLGLSVWFAPLTLEIGDRLLDSINAGLAASEYGLLILSPSYLAKNWTNYELDVLHRQHIEQNKKLLPLWHGVNRSQVDNWNPGIGGLFALNTTQK